MANRKSCMIASSIFIFSISGDAYSIMVTQTTNADLLLNALTKDGYGGTQPYYSGASDAIGWYSNFSDKFDIGPGVVLSTGNVADYSDGPNNSTNNTTSFGTPGHVRLGDISGSPTYDAARFGFDFQATSNQISFDFVFGSEEYPEFVGSAYNDSFGVFLSDENGTVTQVAKDTNGNLISINSAYMTAGSNGELDGTTGKLRTEVSLSVGRNYSIEFAIADAGDSAYDSTAFISSLEGVAPTSDTVDIHGLFVGANEAAVFGFLPPKIIDNTNFNAGDGARAVRDSFDTLANTHSSELLTFTGSYDHEKDAGGSLIKKGGIASQDVLDRIDEEIQKVDKNDIFTFYLGGHGGKDAFGNTAISLGEEYIFDFQLASVLRQYPDVQKWVFVDSCFSGGFWDDLEDIPNVSFLSSTDKNTLSLFISGTGRTLFSMGIEDALKISGGHFNADKNRDGMVDLTELHSYLSTYSFLFMQDNTEQLGFTAGVDLPSEYLEFDQNLIGYPFMQSNSTNAGFMSAPSNYSATTSPTQVPLPSSLFLFLAGAISFIFAKPLARTSIHRCIRTRSFG